MDSEYILDPNGELYHWGIKGMRWGIRRYQNKDGSLTKAGKKRYDAETEKLKEREKTIKTQERTKAKLAKLEAKKAELDAREEALKNPNKAKGATKAKTSDASGQKSIKDMTDDELREHTTRMLLEKNYLDAQKNLAIANPKKVSAGEKFVKGLVGDVVVPAAKNAGRMWLEKTMKDKLGLNTEDTVARLEKHARKLELEKKIAKLKNNNDDDDLSWDERQKKQTYEWNEYLHDRERKKHKNEDSGRNNSSSQVGSNSQNKRPEPPDQYSSNNPSKQSKQTSQSSKTKQNKTSAEYGTKDYEKQVDALLAEMDARGWDIYNNKYRRDD